jgi:hypothetical protein
MYSYPNRIPLPLTEIRRIKEQVQPISFDNIFDFYDYQNIKSDVKKYLKILWKGIHKKQNRISIGSIIKETDNVENEWIAGSLYHCVGVATRFSTALYF